MSEHDRALLAAISAWLPHDGRVAAFNTTTLVYAAADDARLLAALAFLPVRLMAHGGWLDEASKQRIDAWLNKVDGREIGGYLLRRDELGWARIEVLP